MHRKPVPLYHHKMTFLDWLLLPLLLLFWGSLAIPLLVTMFIALPY